MQLAATSLLFMKDLAVTQEPDIDYKTSTFANIFQGISNQANDLPVKEDAEPSEWMIEKIKQILEQMRTGEGIKDERFNTLPFIPLEEPQFLNNMQADVDSWSEAVALILEDHALIGDLEEEDIEPIAQMIGRQLAAMVDKEPVKKGPTIEIPLNFGDRIHSREGTDQLGNESEETMKHAQSDREEKAIQLIQTVLNETSQRDVNVNLTRLLEKAYKLNQDHMSTPYEASETTEQEKKPSMLALIDEPESPGDIWNNLQVMYEKRTALTDGGAYVDKAKVRSSDIASWMGQHVSAHQQMTPVEQYVLHMNRHDGENEKSEQMMQQLRQIIGQSGFGKNDLFQQLSIQIQPEQLGDMKITLVRIDGELIAKITVHTQVAKQALESQMHQLKHLFSPHQVMIEREDDIDQARLEQDDPQEDMDNEHEAKEQDEGSPHEEQAESSFHDQFEQLLNERKDE